MLRDRRNNANEGSEIKIGEGRVPFKEFVSDDSFNPLEETAAEVGRRRCSPELLLVDSLPLLDLQPRFDVALLLSEGVLLIQDGELLLLHVETTQHRTRESGPSSPTTGHRVGRNIASLAV